MARGYYTRTTLAAMNFRNGTLSKLWQFDSNSTPRDSANHAYTGQGSHSMRRLVLIHSAWMWPVSLAYRQSVSPQPTQ